ncbi:MAG: hypothetical protein J4F35_04795 [Candidatus Latescibacteria bacterium]|nr:hypothetical protein [Candidatus Latescibacterota bacterium]
MNNPVICLRSLASIAAIVASALGFQSISYGESPAEAGKIYWTEAKDFGWIQRAELDGANVESVLTTELTIAPHHLALDWWGEGKIYWTERNGESDISTIRRADRDGNNVETLFMGAEQITAIALDPFGGKMYWATWNPGTILRADLDGFNVETLLTGIGNPSGIVLDAYVFTVEMLSGGVPASKMYWTEYDTGTIRRADLDGSDLDGFNIETLVTEIRNPLGIALDWPFQDVHEHVEQKMYWTEKEAGVIRRADLDGFNIETLVTAEESIIAFSLQLGRWGGDVLDGVEPGIGDGNPPLGLCGRYQRRSHHRNRGTNSPCREFGYALVEFGLEHNSEAGRIYHLTGNRGATGHRHRRRPEQDVLDR